MDKFRRRVLLTAWLACSALAHSSVSPDSASIEQLRQAFAVAPDTPVAVVSVARQRMDIHRPGEALVSYPVSTSKYGIGNRAGSERTPLGVHRVAQRFGDGAAPGTLFRARRNMGVTVPIIHDQSPADGDYVTTRILWLDGLEEGVNRGPGIDSFKRYIYIHGTAEEGRIGRPASHGCIRMTNADVIEAFELLPVGSLVDIRP